MHAFIRRRPVFVAAVLAALLPGACATAACGGSGTGQTAAPAATLSSGAPSPMPSALTETYTSQTYGFSFDYPQGFTVQVEPDFIQTQADVFDLALLSTAETAAAFGFHAGNLVRLVVLVSDATEGEQQLDGDGVAQEMIAGIEDYLASLDGLGSTGVKPVDIDGFAGAQVAYSHDTPEGRTDTWLLNLVEPEGGYSLEVQATSPADQADLLEPVWTEVVNSFTTL